MNLLERLNAINKEIQSYTIDNYNAFNNSLFNKLEELKKLMVTAYENNEGINKYMVRLPMWLIDINLMAYKKHSRDKDQQVRDRVFNDCKRMTNEAIDLFEGACMEKNYGMFVQEGF